MRPSGFSIAEMGEIQTSCPQNRRCFFWFPFNYAKGVAARSSTSTGAKSQPLTSAPGSCHGLEAFVSVWCPSKTTPKQTPSDRRHPWTMDTYIHGWLTYTSVQMMPKCMECAGCAWFYAYVFLIRWYLFVDLRVGWFMQIYTWQVFGFTYLMIPNQSKHHYFDEYDVCSLFCGREATLIDTHGSKPCLFLGRDKHLYNM